MSAAGAATGVFSKILSQLNEMLSGGSGGSCVGLSIGSSSIKLVELQKAGKLWKLLHFGVVQLPEETIVNREIVNQLAVVDNLKTLVNQLKLKTKDVCTSISGNSIIIKNLSLEIPNKRDIKDQVFWEAEQYLPFDVSEVVMDYQVLSRSKDGQTNVMIVAAKTSVLESYQGVIEGAKLRPKIVDTDFFALQNVYEANYQTNPSEAVAIVDIGATSLKVVVVHNGVPVFTKDSAIGGRNLTLEIQKQLNLAFTDAESLKVGAGGDGGVPQEVSELMHIMSENFAAEIKRALDFYNASAIEAPISLVLLTGGSALIHEFSKTVEDVCKVPSQLINPFNSISYDPSVFTPDYISAIAPIASVPIGLALRAGAK